LISVINDLAIVELTDDQINNIVLLVTRKKFQDAANYMVNNNLTDQNFTSTRTRLSETSVTNSQTLRYPAAIAIPDDDTYTVTSSQFTYAGKSCILRNKLSSNIIQVVTAAGDDVVLDNIGSYNASNGTITIDYFNPTSIAGGATQVKLSALPANQSAITPTRNDLLVYDPNRTAVTAVTVSATN